MLNLNHKKLDVYVVAKELVTECYKITKHFPPEEKYGLTNQIRRAAVSVLLNIAERSSRKYPTDRRRFYEISRGSLIEVDAAFEIAVELKFYEKETALTLNKYILKTFKLLCNLIKSTN